jgi:hypothetical protein
MTVEASPRRSRRPKPTPEQLAIGEINQTVFTCPQCTRPLMMGSKRCPGCGTRLIIGVQASRAGILLAVGLFAGLLLGAVLSTTASVVFGVIGDTVEAVTNPSVKPSAAPTPSASAPAESPGSSTTSTVPALSRSALVQAVSVDGRLAASSNALARAIKAKSLDTFGVSQILRSMSSDAVIGLQLASHIGSWSGGKQLSSEMSSFYAAIQETAASGLSATIRNDKAYRNAGARMVALLGGLAALDVRIQDVAIGAGITPVPAASVAP